MDQQEQQKKGYNKIKSNPRENLLDPKKKNDASATEGHNKCKTCGKTFGEKFNLTKHFSFTRRRPSTVKNVVTALWVPMISLNIPRSVLMDWGSLVTFAKLSLTTGCKCTIAISENTEIYMWLSITMTFYFLPCILHMQRTVMFCCVSNIPSQNWEKIFPIYCWLHVVYFLLHIGFFVAFVVSKDTTPDKKCVEIFIKP